MLGHKVFQALQPVFPETLCTVRLPVTDERVSGIPLFREGAIFGVDATDTKALAALLAEYRPDVIVNCVGVVKQRADAAAALPCISTNALLPHQLAAWAGGWGGRVIHFSTDCVFSGRRGNYSEADESDAEDLYGRSKFLGELKYENALTLRTSIIGRELFHHQSLLEWFLSRRGTTVKGFTRVIYSGVTTVYLARLVSRLLQEDSKLSGLYQVASDPICKHDLLCMLRDAYELDVVIEPNDAEVSDRSMDGSRFVRDTGYKCPPWTDLVAELAADPTPYQEWMPGAYQRTLLAPGIA